MFRTRRGRVRTAALLAPKRVPAHLSKKKMWSHCVAQARNNDENQKGGSQRATREDNLAIDGKMTYLGSRSIKALRPSFTAYLIAGNFSRP